MTKTLRILITAGPTIEPIDPVRFISNRSTGLMGYELARLAKKRRYKVILISGPTNIRPPKGVEFLPIETAGQMYKEVRQNIGKADILVMASAVSDFRPLSFSKNKIKKTRKDFTLKLIRNRDILKSVSNIGRKNKILVGFSLETKDVLKNAADKLRDKNLDLIVANKVSRYIIPFGKGDKTVYLLDNHGRQNKLYKWPKTRIASAILDTIEDLCYTPN